MLCCIECSTIGAHDARNFRTDHILAEFHFKSTQYGIIEKCAALHDDMMTKLCGVCAAYDLIQRIFHDAHGKTGGDIFDGCTVLLRLLDGAVHENRAA